MVKENQSKNLNQKNAVEIKVIELDGAPVLRVIDSHLKLSYDAAMPPNFYTLPPVKQNYWINKELQIIARQIKQDVKARKWDH